MVHWEKAIRVVNLKEGTTYFLEMEGGVEECGSDVVHGTDPSHEYGVSTCDEFDCGGWLKNAHQE